MSKLNIDVLYLIFEELKYDNITLYSCLSVNKVCFKLIIPILWKNPWNYLGSVKEELLFNVFISHLSDETKEHLKGQYINLPSEAQQKPLLNYISFCRHLDICVLERIISDNINIKESKKSIVK